MQFENTTIVKRSESVLATNSVLRNTYLLLSLTLVFSAITAGISVITNAPPVNPLLTIVGYLGLLFATHLLRNSAWGLVTTFALTGFMGYTLGPILNIYLHHIVNGQQLIMMSLGATGIIFFALSGYALTTRKDFSYMNGFIMVGLLVAFLVGLGALIFKIPGLMLAISAVFVLLSSGVILVQTSQIINGGERNYILATISLYVSLYNIFVNLLSILGFFNNRE